MTGIFFARPLRNDFSIPKVYDLRVYDLSIRKAGLRRDPVFPQANCSPVVCAAGGLRRRMGSGERVSRTQAHETMGNKASN